MVSHGRRLEVGAFIGRLEKWATDRDDVVAVAIVGSWAGDSAREDSDVDVVLLTDDVSVFLEGDGWIAEFAPAAELVRKAEWGAIAERRLRLPSGLEIELGVGRPSRGDGVSHRERHAPRLQFGVDLRCRPRAIWRTGEDLADSVGK